MGNIGSSIQSQQHLEVFAQVADHRLGLLDLNPILVYIIDTVPANILPFLADQLDVAGIRGIAVADTEEQQREIIRRSIELHRYKGTVWGVREAIKSVGFVDVEIIEGVDAPIQTYAGGITHNGAVTYSSGGESPFNFSIVIDASDVSRLTPEKRGQLVKMVNEYKNVRSRLVSIVYRETIRPTYNGRVDYDATIDYDYQLYVLNVNV